MSYHTIKELRPGGQGKIAVVADESGKKYVRKVLHHMEDEDLRRFNREFRILSNLNHPNIIKILEWDMDNASYIMPYYPRGHLTYEMIKDNPTLRLHFIDQILCGVKEIHEHKAIHRDLKPQNILIDNETIVISDFGFARKVVRDTTPQTPSGRGFGTPPYMAPEQVNDAKNVGPEADIYSLGRIFYELFTGALPSGWPPDCSMLPQPFNLAVKKMLNLDPRRRFSSIQDITFFIDLFGQETRLQILGDKFKKVISSEPEEVTERELIEIFKLLTGLEDNTEEFVSLFFQIPHPVNKKLMTCGQIDYSHLFELLVSSIKKVMSGGFPFQQSDTWGEYLVTMLEYTQEEDFRRGLYLLILVIGVEVNRYFVQGLFKKILKSTIDENNVSLLVGVLEEGYGIFGPHMFFFEEQDVSSRILKVLMRKLKKHSLPDS